MKKLEIERILSTIEPAVESVLTIQQHLFLSFFIPHTSQSNKEIKIIICEHVHSLQSLSLYNCSIQLYTFQLLLVSSCDSCSIKRLWWSWYTENNKECKIYLLWSFHHDMYVLSFEEEIVADRKVWLSLVRWWWFRKRSVQNYHPFLLIPCYLFSLSLSLSFLFVTNNSTNMSLVIVCQNPVFIPWFLFHSFLQVTLQSEE